MLLAIAGSWRRTRKRPSASWPPIGSSSACWSGSIGAGSWMPGDALLAEFRSALDATRCALEIQRVVGARNQPISEDRRMEFRIGIHLGDVMVKGEEIYGTGVNIAARLEGLAEPGGVCISGTVHEQVREKLRVAYVDLGEQAVKNIPAPVHVYRVEQPTELDVSTPSGYRGLRTALAAAATLVLLVAASMWATWPRPMGVLIDLTGAGAPPVDPRCPTSPRSSCCRSRTWAPIRSRSTSSTAWQRTSRQSCRENGALFVISRSSAFTYKGQAINVENVGRELGVRYVLEGSVRRAGGRLRVTAQLIDATSGFHLWSEHYDRKLADIFALQSELAEKIQTAMRVEIRDAEIGRARRGATEDVDAYDAMIRGLSHFERIRREDNLEARRWFRASLRARPQLRRGTRSVRQHSCRGIQHGMEPESCAARARGGIGATRSRTWRPECGRVQYARECPHGAPRHRCGTVGLGARDRGRAESRCPPPVEGHRSRLRRPNPAGPGLHQPRPAPEPNGDTAQRIAIGFVNYRAGRIAEAVAVMEEVRAENPDLVLPRLLLIFHRDVEGRHDEVRTLVGEVLRVNPSLTAAEANRISLGFEADDVFRRAGLPWTSRTELNRWPAHCELIPSEAIVGTGAATQTGAPPMAWFALWPRPHDRPIESADVLRSVRPISLASAPPPLCVAMLIVVAAKDRERRARAFSRVIRPGSAAADRLERSDAQYWRSLSPTERFLLASRLSLEQWRMNGRDRTSGRPSRSVESVHRPWSAIPHRRRIRARGSRPSPCDRRPRCMDRVQRAQRRAGPWSPARFRCSASRPHCRGSDDPRYGLPDRATPVRVDVLTRITGVEFDAAWPDRQDTPVDDLVVPVHWPRRSARKQTSTGPHPGSGGHRATRRRRKHLRRWEPNIGVEPMTCALRKRPEGAGGAVRAVSARFSCLIVPVCACLWWKVPTRLTVHCNV